MVSPVRRSATVLSTMTAVVALAVACTGGPAIAADRLPTNADALRERGISVDASYDEHSTPVFAGAAEGGTSVTAVCPDRGAVALSFWQQSGQGCAVIGTTASTKVYFQWYKHHGPATAVSVLARGFNSNAVPTYYECGTATTGRTKAIPWGKVASAKYIKMISNHVNGAKLQWS